MSRRVIPSRWKTERFLVEDSTLDEVDELQYIYDQVPQIRGFTRVDDEDEPKYPMLFALQEGVLPPLLERSKEFFRLQSIRMSGSEELIGFLGVYHGFPQEDIFWMNVIALHPNFQGKGYGVELMIGLSDIVRQLGSYTRIRTFVSLTNWPSLRLCAKVGLDKMVTIVGDKVYSNKAEAHVLLEKSLEPL